MSEFLGADVADLRDFAKTMDQASHSLAQQAQSLHAAINQTRGWRGPDADRFRQVWSTSHRPALASTARTLQDVSDLLRKNAAEQEQASSVASLSGGSGGGPGGSSGLGTDPGQVDTVKDYISTGLKALGVSLGIKGFVGNLKDHTKFLADKQWAKFNEANKAFKTFQAEGGLLGKLGQAGQVIGKTQKLIGAFSRFAGPLLAPLAVGTGIHDMFNPSHEGWRGAGDRIAGGLSVVAGVGSVLIFVGAVANPVGVAVLVGAGVVAGAWALGNMVADSQWGKAAGKRIGQAVTDIGKTTSAAVANVVGETKNAVGKAVNNAKDFLSNPIKSLGGLFA